MVCVQESSHTFVKTVSVMAQRILSHQVQTQKLFPAWMHFYHIEECNCPAGKIHSLPQYHAKLKLFLFDLTYCLYFETVLKMNSY